MLQLISRAGVPPIHWIRGMSQATGAAPVLLQRPTTWHLPVIPPSPSPLPCPMTIQGLPCPILRGAGQCRGASTELSSCQYPSLPSTQTGPGLWLGPGLVLTPVMLSETPLTSDSYIKGPWTPPNITPEWVSGCGRGTPAREKPYMICVTSHMMSWHPSASSSWQNLLSQLTCWQSTAVPGFMAAETPADPQPRQQHSQDLQHPYNGLACNFDRWGRKKRRRKKNPKGNKDALWLFLVLYSPSALTLKIDMMEWEKKKPNQKDCRTKKTLFF